MSETARQLSLPLKKLKSHTQEIDASRCNRDLPALIAFVGLTPPPDPCRGCAAVSVCYVNLKLTYILLCKSRSAGVLGVLFRVDGIIPIRVRL